MNIAFFVQNNLVERMTVPVACYARENGMLLYDRSSAEDFNPDDCGIDWTDLIVFPFGSVQFIRKIQNSSLRKFIFHDPIGFSSNHWLNMFGDKLLNGSGQIIPLSNVSDYLSVFGPMHLRPNSVDKAFTGAVYDIDTWANTKKIEDPQLLCWASPVQHILSEWRCWIVDGQVVEICQYRKDNAMFISRTFEQSVYDAAQDMANIYTPSECVVMDLALTKNGYKLIEFNPIQSSGWYGADSNAVLREITLYLTKNT
jgi:hypothetical protein